MNRLDGPVIKLIDIVLNELDIATSVGRGFDLGERLLDFLDGVTPKLVNQGGCLGGFDSGLGGFDGAGAGLAHWITLCCYIVINAG